jgi:hypothetical protein
MSISTTNFIDFRLPETRKSDDPSDEANRRREMRRKQQSAALKIQNQNRLASKNLLDEVLGKEFVQSKNKSLANQPDIGRHQGLPVPAQFNDKAAKNILDDQEKSSDFDPQSSLEEARELLENHDLSMTDRIDNLNKFNEDLESNEKLEINRQASEFHEDNAEIEQKSSLRAEKFTQSPLSMVTSQLDKLKQQILLIDQNRLQDGMNPQNLKELAEQQKSMATSLDFLEGYADGVVKDEAGRQQFEQSCTDLREQLLQSEHNFNLSLGAVAINQPKQLLNQSQSQSQSQSQRIAEVNDRMMSSNKRELDERARLSEDASEIQDQEVKQTSSRLDDTNSTQRVRSAKRDRANAESTLPLLVQRSV